jgi:hypothetical protein
MGIEVAELSMRRKTALPSEGSGTNFLVPGMTGAKAMGQAGLPAEESPAT